ncbi:MAG TPA: hypothetical protein VLQ90_09845 [Pyrinomonadaceae bacterium]|nr:hypothetical protein [Pyrinomonadaceae bacterium]
MKGQTRNIETYKVGTGARLNEFDFHKAQEEMHEHHGDEPGTGPRQSETTAKRLARLTKTAHEKVVRRKKHRG